MLWLALAVASQSDLPKRLLSEDDVIISASRLEENPRDVGSSATLIEKRELELAQRRFVLDALREVPGLDAVATGSRGGVSSVFIRGANSEHTLLLLDGIEMHDASSAGRAFDFAHLMTDNLERIEVIRGPQSVLYGSDAIGGVIQLISATGKGDPRLRLTAEGGSFATYRGAFDVSGGDELFQYALAASHLRSDGFSSADDDLPGNDEDDGYENSTLGAKLGLTPSKTFGLALVVRGIEARSDFDNGAGAFQDDPNHEDKFRQWAFKLEPRAVLFDGVWEQTLALKLSQSRRDTDNSPDSGSPVTLVSDFESRVLDVDWQHNFRVHPADVITLGAEFEKDRASTSFFSDEFGPFFSEIDGIDAWTRGVYAQNRLSLAEVFTATAGARVDQHEEFGTHATWRLTAAYLLPDAGTKLRGSVGSGFKAPSLFQLYSSFGNPDLEPEESLGFDVGVDQAFGGDVVVLSATYFKNEFEDLILFDSGTGVYFNIGRADSEGGELAVRARPVAGLEVAATYTLTVTEDKTTDEELLRRPRDKGSVRAIVTPTEGLQGTIGVVYTGSREDFDFSTFPAARVTLDDYWLGQFAVSWAPSKAVELFARVENLFDQDYQEALGFGAAEISGYAGASVRF